MSKLNEFKTRLKASFDNAPEKFIATGASAIYLASLAYDRFSSGRSKQAYARVMNQRAKNLKK